MHETTVASKAIIRAFYGAAPKLSYWNGCSSGGKQGLIEAQRYPEDFDGIVAGAPANYWTHLLFGIVWSGQATHEGQPGNLSRDKLVLLHDAVLRACDALDGVKDGVLEDPTRCKFDPGALECKGADGATCLTAGQVEGARKMYSGAINPRTHQQIYPGMALGSELGWDPVNGLQPLAIAVSYFRYVLFKDPNWDYRQLNFDSDRHSRGQNRCRSPQCDGSEFTAVLCPRRQTDPVSRLERSADFPVEQHRLLSERATEAGRRAQCKRLLPLIYGARDDALRRRPGSQSI